MLPEERQKRIEQIRRVVAETKIVPIATVSPGGLPHNSPVFMTFDADFNAIWASDPTSQHSQIIARIGHAFLTVFDSSNAVSGGLYIDALASMISAEDPDFLPALKVYAEAKQRVGAPMPTKEDFTKAEGQRLYIAVPQSLWINHVFKDEQGKVVRDQRFRVTVAALKEQ